jgi:hypothetical protein
VLCGGRNVRLLCRCRGSLLALALYRRGRCVLNDEIDGCFLVGAREAHRSIGICLPFFSKTSWLTAEEWADAAARRIPECGKSPLRQGRHDVRDRGWQWCLMTWRSIALRASLRNHPHQVTAGLIGMCVWGCLQSRDCSETAVCDGFDSKSEAFTITVITALPST